MPPAHGAAGLRRSYKNRRVRTGVGLSRLGYRDAGTLLGKTASVLPPGAAYGGTARAGSRSARPSADDASPAPLQPARFGSPGVRRARSRRSASTPVPVHSVE